MDFHVNEDLVSGLLTALNQFAIIELKQPIESIDMSGLRWVYELDKDSNLLFIIADTKDIQAEMLRARLNVIKNEFIQEYIKNKQEWREKWDGNIDIFRPFQNIIEEYYAQWKQAESITSIAEFFDILGVFQQILNMLMNIMINIFGESKDRIIERIESMFEVFRSHKYVIRDPELSKISFDRNSGFNIISIVPMNCDMIVVEKQIIGLIKAVVDIIKQELGDLESFRLFIQENIFEYIFNNYALLKELNLDKFLLQLFLQK